MCYNWYLVYREEDYNGELDGEHKGDRGAARAEGWEGIEVDDRDGECGLFEPGNGEVGEEWCEVQVCVWCVQQQFGVVLHQD